MSNPINTTTITINNFLKKPVMAEVKLCKRFSSLPKEEKEWFYDHKDFYFMGRGRYMEKKANKMFVEEYNAQLKSRAKREYEVAMMAYEKQMEIQKTLGFHAVATKESPEHNVHCNKTIYSYSFSRAISKEEFILFLEKVGKRIAYHLNWWDDYAIIKGNGEEWEYVHATSRLRPFNEECLI